MLKWVLLMISSGFLDQIEDNHQSTIQLLCQEEIQNVAKKYFKNSEQIQN